MIALSAHLGTLFQERDPLDRPAAARDSGYGVVEAWWPPAPDPARWPGAVRAAGLRAVLLNADGGDLAAGERGFCNLPDRAEHVLASAVAAARIVTAAGGDRVNLLVGRYTGDRPEDDQLETAAAVVRTAAETVAPWGVTIVVEHLNAVDVDRPLLPTPAAAAAFVERVGHPGVRVLFDAYHAAMAGLDPLEEVGRVAPLVGHVQFADHPGRGAPGTGTLDLWALVDRLRALGYDGAVGLEFLPGGPTPPVPVRG
ncbi:MAG TPA: TIM barrel protein [Miltoncostaea sp.]|nr:TIM barrel protein [Miltoncostaea sp.]